VTRQTRPLPMSIDVFYPLTLVPLSKIKSAEHQKSIPAESSLPLSTFGAGQGMDGFISHGRGRVPFCLLTFYFIYFGANGVAGKSNEVTLYSRKVVVEKKGGGSGLVIIRNVICYLFILARRNTNEKNKKIKGEIMNQVKDGMLLTYLFFCRPGSLTAQSNPNPEGWIVVIIKLKKRGT